MVRMAVGPMDRVVRSRSPDPLDKGYPVAMLVAEPYLGELRANEKFHAMIIASSF